MQLQTVGTDWRPKDMVEGYNSLIWTERFQEAGDFTLKTPKVKEMMGKIPKGTLLTLQDSWEVMIVEDVLLSEGTKGDELTVTGRSMMSCLDYRTLVDNRRYRMTTPPQGYVWDYGDGEYTPVAMSIMIEKMTGAISNDKIFEDDQRNSQYQTTAEMFYSPPSSAPAYPPQPSRRAPNQANDDIADGNWIVEYYDWTRWPNSTGDNEDSEDIAWFRWFSYRYGDNPDTTTEENGPLDPVGYNYIVEMLKERNRGLYFMRTPFLAPAQPYCYWVIKDPTDRTINQSANPKIVLDVEAGHVLNPKYLWSNKDYRNIAYVKAPIGFKIVAAPGVSTGVSGFNRRVLQVDASDLTKGGSSVAYALKHRGLLELAQWNKTQLADVEVSPNIPFKYGPLANTPPGVDYGMGDYLTVSLEYGMTQTMQVVEYIRTEDNEGNSSEYPTLAAVDYLT